MHSAERWRHPRFQLEVDTQGESIVINLVYHLLGLPFYVCNDTRQFCLHFYLQVNDYKNCYTGNKWDQSLCPDPKTCTKNCALDGVDSQTWKDTYGVKIANNNEMTLQFVTQGPYSKNIGSRTYLLDSSHERLVRLITHKYENNCYKLLF